ncbi:MAG: adenosylcobinamide-phosphate synthase CbiB [Candidatus Electrothrix sp. YB6]
MSFPFPAVLFLACLLDALFGDPRWLPHPVRMIGWAAVWAETFTRRLPLSAFNSGRLTVLLVLLSTGGVCAFFFVLLDLLPRPFFLLGAAVLLYTSIAARDLLHHTQQVADALDVNIRTARQQVGMIVGRDTDRLDEAGVIRACVESVAENMSDGIIAPIFWAVTGAFAAQQFGGDAVVWGVTAAMLYKAVNTMDSMFGYTNEQYLQFGFCPARLDDAVNFFPARLSGITLVAAAFLCGNNAGNSWRILLRDRQQHSSPNAGWPEAAMAGALGLQLGGTSSYFGRTCYKPTLGDPLDSPGKKHIRMANTLVLTASLLCLLLFSSLYIVGTLLF